MIKFEHINVGDTIFAVVHSELGGLSIKECLILEKDEQTYKLYIEDIEEGYVNRVYFAYIAYSIEEALKILEKSKKYLLIQDKNHSEMVEKTYQEVVKKFTKE